MIQAHLGREDPKDSLDRLDLLEHLELGLQELKDLKALKEFQDIKEIPDIQVRLTYSVGNMYGIANNVCFGKRDVYVVKPVFLIHILICLAEIVFLIFGCPCS